MNETLLDISGKIDGEALAALARVKASADKLGFPFFIIGATARDIFLKHIHGLEELRKTKDIDFGVSMSTWKEYSKLKADLVETQGFIDTPRFQRLRFGRLEIDLVPFGKIAGAGQNLVWPPDETHQMNTAGFDEAFRFSPLVKVSSVPEVIVRVCSLPGLVALKLISWQDRPPDRQNDAEDIFEIMDRYKNVIGLDRLYSDERDLILAEGFDSKKAAIRILGRDIARMVSPVTRRIIGAILDEETKKNSKLRLAYSVARGLGAKGVNIQDILGGLAKLKQGLTEADE